MNIVCPHCHRCVTVSGLGRPRLDVPVINVCDAVKRYKTITRAARALGVSRGYIYKTLKDTEANLDIKPPDKEA